MKKRLIIIGALTAALLLLLVGYLAVLRPILDRKAETPSPEYLAVSGDAAPGTLYFVSDTYRTEGFPDAGTSVDGLYRLDELQRIFVPAAAGETADGTTAYYGRTAGGYTLVSPMPDGFRLTDGTFYVYGIFSEAAGTANGTAGYYERKDGVYRYAGIPASGAPLEGLFSFTPGNVTVDDLEQLTDNGLFLMYPVIDRANMQTIRVTNEHGSYVFYRNERDSFVLADHETVYLSAPVFSALVSTVGYPSTSFKICDFATAEQLAEYGLDDPVASFTVTTIHGESRTVEIGDPLLGNTGYYYVRMAGRDSIYAFAVTKPVISEDYSSMSYMDVVLEPVESMILPRLVEGLTTNNYYLVDNVILMDESASVLFFIRNIPTNAPSDSLSSSTVSGQASALSTAFFASPAGYQVNTDLFWNTVYSFAYGSLRATSCVCLSPGEEELEAYGLMHPHRVWYMEPREAITDGEGRPISYITTGRVSLYFSERQPDGTYYVISSLQPDLVASVDADSFGFLEEPFFTWVSKSVFPENIRAVSSLRVESASQDVTFTLHHSEQPSTYLDSSGRIRTEYTYLLDVTTDTGFTIPNSEITNFRKMYIALLSISLRGRHELDAEQVSQVTADAGRRVLRFTYTLTDGSTTVLEFYSYTSAGRRILLSVNGSSEFYVNAADIDEIDESVRQVLAGIKVDPYKP